MVVNDPPQMILTSEITQVVSGKYTVAIPLVLKAY